MIKESIIKKQNELILLKEMQQNTLNKKEKEINWYKMVLNYIESNIIDENYFYTQIIDGNNWFIIKEYNPLRNINENQIIYGLRDLEKLKHYVIDKITLDEKRINNTLKELNEINEKINEMLKYFRKDLKPLEKGKVIKLLEKKYNSPFKEEGLKGYEVPLYVIVNFAIENNLRFYLQFKTLENECLKVFDKDLNKWV